MSKDFKKYLILGFLFFFPIFVYVFLSTGINNFAKLPVLTENVKDIKNIEGNILETSFKDKISIVAFWGGDINKKKSEALNLNQKIYKRFYQFKDFQFIMIQPKGTSELTQNLRTDLKTGTDTDLINWKFISIEDDQLLEIFNSLKTNLSLDSNLGTPYVFIIDRDSNLRGRDDDDGVKYGYDSRSVADINNNMLDDVKVILAEYRMALKKNNRYKENLD